MQQQYTQPISVPVEEAARASGLTRNQIYEAIKNGKLRSAYIGKRRLVLWESLQKYIGEHVAGVDPADSNRGKSMRSKRTAKAKGETA